MSTYAITPGFTRTTRTTQSPRTAVRLTRRGRLLAVLTVFGSQSAATGEAGTPVATRTVQVGEGDTLWGIASSAAEPGQVREMVHQIQELNALSGAGLQVGQQIAVPAS